MKIILMILLSLCILYAKKDFYYNFINEKGKQISQDKIQEINDGFEMLDYIKKLATLDKIYEAYSQIVILKEKNKIKVLNSDIILLYSQLAFKKNSKQIIFEAEFILEKAINSSEIYENDLSKAYMLLIDLKLKVNKVKEAKYFANIIINNFDNKLIQTYGKIYLAKTYKHQNNYKKSIRMLYKILTKTRDITIATIVADELFDLYILNNEKQKAYDLMKKVLKTNIKYYAKDSYLALKKINRLIKSDMLEFSVEILEALLKQTNEDSIIEDFKFKLANIYMLMYDKKNINLLKAKELYKDIINDYPKAKHAKKSKMFLDEILMRQHKLKPSTLLKKYKDSESIQQKVLLQELLNNKKNKNYDFIFKAKKVYLGISNIITKRFGYKSINAIYDDIYIDIIKSHLNNNQCILLDKALKDARKKTLKKLIKNDDIKYKFFQCLVEVPNINTYSFAKETFSLSRDSNIYLYLEQIAYKLHLYDEALEFSSKIEMTNNRDILSKEFLYRFLILNEKNNLIILDRFFKYARNNNDYIINNSKNPIIIDFYYFYYLYLIKKNFSQDANDILYKLFTKQKESKAYIYSPFVELELINNLKSKDLVNNKKAINILIDLVKYTRKMKSNDLAKIYYKLIKLYEISNNKIKSDEFLNKCKELKNTKKSLYKKMCDEL